MTPVDDYVLNWMQPGFRSSLDVHRSFEIATQRQCRCLSPNGEQFFVNAVQGYLAGCEEAKELVDKAQAFLALARSVGERQKYDYVRGYCEGVRSTMLSYVQWLSGADDPSLLHEAQDHFTVYYTRAAGFSRGEAAAMAPALLYTESYHLIRAMAERLSIGLGPGSRHKASGLFGHALRIALASSPSDVEAEKRKLKQRLPKRLFAWIDTGQYDNVAYCLHALFPRPAGPPSRLIEECWQYIPENIIAKRMAELRAQGLVK